LSVTPRHTINSEVGYGTGSISHALALYGVRQQADAQGAPPGDLDHRSAASANAVIVNLSSLLACCIIAFRALLIDAGVVALLIAFRGAAALPVPVLVNVAVLVDVAVVMVPVALNLFQGDS
jgi:hypothetical protein